MSEIKWSYNESTGQFSALPASNFLALAIAFRLSIPLMEKIYWAHFTRPRQCPEIDLELAAKYKVRYKVLLDKKLSGRELTLEERAEWVAITNPPWAKPGERWQY